MPTTSVTGPAAEDAAAFLARVQALPVPQRDMADLAQRLRHAGSIPTRTQQRTQPASGSKDVFWVTDMENMEHFTVTATLRYASDHLYMYVDDSISDISDSSLRSSANAFESAIYPTTRRYFGTAWAAGLDGDAHIAVLHIRNLGATGAFSSADEESPTGNPYSNARHMIYMNAEHIQPGTRAYNGVLVHEFQHAIHFFQDRNEDAWVNEGASVLSEMLNGFDTWNQALELFRRYPDTQLTTWGDEPDRGAHYGAAFAFLAYFRERYGDQALLWLIEEPANGVQGFNRVLARLGKSERFDDVYADWMVANVLDAPALTDGRYGYTELDLHMTANASARSFPASAIVSTPQYAAYYVEFSPPQGTAAVYFTGTAQTQLVGNQAHSGRLQWWSNRGDLMDSTLTRPFDLSSLSSATLAFWTWFDLEKDWDYAYVAVSSDDGRTWTTLPTRRTTTSDPVGNNLGNGYTGRSGGGKTALWVADQADLTPYAGRKVLVRFEYVTDDAVTNPGFCVDDISIAELGFSDDAETSAGWEARGFVLSSNAIPQTFVLRLIVFGEHTTVQPVPIDAQGYAHITLSGGKRAILAIAGVAPITTEPAQFRYTMREP